MPSDEVGSRAKQENLQGARAEVKFTLIMPSDEVGS